MKNKQVKSKQVISVWDIVVRLTHWTLAICVFLNLTITEEGESIHIWVGYVAVFVVVLRLIWGFVGTRYARFGDFFPTFGKLKQHISDVKNRRPEKHLGHNPLGALMMFALWGCVLGLGISGYMLEMEQFYADERLEDMHEFCANLLIPLIALHVLAVIVMSKISKINLAKAMITGDKYVADD